MKAIYLFLMMNYWSSPEIHNYYLITEIRSEVAVPADSFVKQKSNINFIMYAFVEKRHQVNYVLEGKSPSVNKWEIIDIKEGFRSPGGQKLSYYFRDTLEVSGEKMDYRVRRIWSEKKLIPAPMNPASGSITAEAFKDDITGDKNKSFSFINKENYKKITVMYFNETGNLVHTHEYMNVEEVNISGYELSAGKYYVVIEGDGNLYPAKILEVVE